MASSSSNPQADRDMEMMEFLIGELTKQGRYTEAAEGGQRLLEKSRSVLGPEHPRTLSTMYHFGAVTHVAGKFEEAEQNFRQLLLLRENVLGQDDPDTIAVLDAISESLSSMRKYKEAMKMLDEELRRCERAFGPEHELTIKTLKNIGQVYMMQGDSHLAISVLLRALELSERLFGSEHSTTSRIQDDLTKIRGPQDSLALRQMLAIKHGLPIPSDPLAGIRSMNRSQLLRRYQNVTGMMSGGPEVINAVTMRLSEEIGRDPQPPIHMPSAYSDGGESNDDDSTVIASSDLFCSLVERSIKAWKGLNQKGLTQAIKQHSQVLRGLKSLDDFLSFRDHQYWFFQLREAFLRQKSFQIWDPDRLDDYIVLPVEGKFANDTDCMFISHYWRGLGHPDPQGLDLQPLQQRLRKGFWGRAAYFWVDFTCLPQWSRISPRTPPQDTYFRRVLLSIPKLVRDCGFTWHFPDFQPRLWVLFESAEFVRNRSRPIALADIEPFMDHLREMKGYGVRYVLNRHGYRCTNQGDRELVIGWLELLLILSRIVPSVRTRQIILNAVDNTMVRTCHHEESGITVDKEKGTVTMNERTYEFSPIPFEATTGSDADVLIKPDSFYEDEVRMALLRVKRAPDDRASEEIGREYDREGEYKIAEVLHRKALADKDSTFIADVLVGLSFLAENLENQGLYEEAEELRSREVKTAEEHYGADSITTLDSRRNLAAVMQKRKLDTYYRRWKLERLETILEMNRPNIPEIDQSDAETSKSLERQAQDLEDQEKLSEAKEVLWALLERRKETLGPYHPDTLTTMSNLGRVLRREKNLAAAEKLFWLALAISDDRWGPEHVKTLSIMSNLAVCMGPAESKEIYRQQLERHLRSVDFDHPDMYTVKFNLFQMRDENEEIQISGGKVLLQRRRWG
ncbi:hypothetical protein DL768_009907 [Monosporascus sp. mg162]|nr:hypothetical protein DL768_009907 [Monosporascus sp. mg162]